MSTLPPDLFDTTTLASLAAVVVILGAAYSLSRLTLASTTPSSLRFLFIWHAFDALIHFALEGSFLYHCFFSYVGVDVAKAKSGASEWGGYYPDPVNYLGRAGVVHGAQAGEDGWLGAMARLWMVYGRADGRWRGVDLGVVSLELLTVFVVGPMACWVCYDIARKNPRANVLMIILATAELYGGFMTFCPEWLTGNLNLDSSNFMYMWVYLVFFNTLWVFIPIYAIYIGATDIMDAFRARSVFLAGKKLN